jgi:hypothetical protein
MYHSRLANSFRSQDNFAQAVFLANGQACILFLNTSFDVENEIRLYMALTDGDTPKDFEISGFADSYTLRIDPDQSRSESERYLVPDYRLVVQVLILAIAVATPIINSPYMYAASLSVLPVCLFLLAGNWFPRRELADKAVILEGVPEPEGIDANIGPYTLDAYSLRFEVCKPGEENTPKFTGYPPRPGGERESPGTEKLSSASLFRVRGCLNVANGVIRVFTLDETDYEDGTDTPKLKRRYSLSDTCKNRPPVYFRKFAIAALSLVIGLFILGTHEPVYQLSRKLTWERVKDLPSDFKNFEELYAAAQGLANGQEFRMEHIRAVPGFYRDFSFMEPVTLLVADDIPDPPDFFSALRKYLPVDPDRRTQKVSRGNMEAFEEELERLTREFVRGRGYIRLNEYYDDWAWKGDDYESANRLLAKMQTAYTGEPRYITSEGIISWIVRTGYSAENFRDGFNAPADEGDMKITLRLHVDDNYSGVNDNLYMLYYFAGVLLTLLSLLAVYGIQAMLLPCLLRLPPG